VQYLPRYLATKEISEVKRRLGLGIDKTWKNIKGKEHVTMLYTQVTNRIWNMSYSLNMVYITVILKVYEGDAPNEQNLRMTTCPCPSA